MEWLRKFLGIDQTRQPEDKKMERNDACWCGSGKKYKVCHIEADQREDAAKACSCTNFG
jgi:hypothetical protein